MIRNKGRYFKMISRYQKEHLLRYMYQTTELKKSTQNLTYLKREIDNLTIIFGDFNATISIIDKTAKHKIRKYLRDFNI